MTDALTRRPAMLADYLATARRRKWIIVIPLLLVPAIAYWLSQGERPLYQASAEIYVKRADIAAAVADVTDPTLQVDPVRYLKTEAELARDPEIARRTAAATRLPMSPEDILGSLNVTPHADADLLDVAVTDANSHNAVVLANAYADEFTKFQTERDTARINEALKSVSAKIKSLRAHGVSIDSPAYGALLENQTKLETNGKLLADNMQVLEPAESADKVSPNPRRDAILGVLFGGVLGIGLAFAAEALDKRVRSEGEIGEALGLPLLGRLPRPARRLRKANKLVMLTEPRSIAAEPVRALRTNIEFANIERDARTIMISSSVQREGKSTTIANLAVALARAGRRVALVDLDLRRPYLHRFLGLKPVPGVADVVVGRADLDEALRVVPVAGASATRSRNGAATEPLTRRSSSNGHGEVQAVLHVLPAGTIPPDAGELVGTEALGDLLKTLRGQFDFVLIDAPPLLVVGDAMSLSAKVDAMVVITRLKVVHRGMLQEIARILEACPAEKFGYVVAGAELGEGYGYAYGYSYATAEAEQTKQQRIS